ncbi:MAG: bis(5'-nucleosyl)-tetraphosphatase (symmetrical) YqeK [Spirochaetales bacterium]|nr:bis(5'-nucleosyl)-tetraphosphatase (symmetrical) YqeK [Spirochaetales bacterium]
MKKKNSTDLHDLYIKIKKDIKKELSPRRYKHSVETAKLAQALCLKYTVASEKGLVAGIAHDIAREYSDDQLVSIVQEQNLCDSEWGLRHPKVLHGIVGAYIVESRYGIGDPDILDAIRQHVAGAENMGMLAKILFVADFCEPSRKYLEEMHRRELLQQPLDMMLFRVYGEIFAFLEIEKKPIAPISYEIYDKLRRKVAMDEKE